MAFGVVAAGAYVPRLRLQRKAIVDTNRWCAPGLASLGKGERAICNWDEDAITMAVEAARDATVGRDRKALTALYFASTTFPFLDRLNAGVVAEALTLAEDLTALDVASSQRCATSALAMALRSGEPGLVIASEHRRTKSASSVELTSGDGAAAIVVGEGTPIARLMGSAQSTVDFVDHFRTAESVYDYQWEERWIRDAGYMTIVPPVIARSLAAANLKAADITYFCMPAMMPRVVNSVAKAAGIAEAAIVDNLHNVCGDTGAAHPLLLLISVLERAKPGERILVVGFGQGADALLFERTDVSCEVDGRLGCAGHLARRREETSYAKFLAFNDLVEIERGMRSETDKLTPLSALWRNRDTVTGMIGGKCGVCGTIQFPISRICANPNCSAVDSQEPHPFAEKTGRVNSFTADRLTYSPDPPACYGMVQFEEGGRWMMDFTDVEADKLAVGMRMRKMFRVKDVDTQRGFRRYFWKAAPIEDGRS
ncbi:MAG: 3-oxoacyl-[acyl-carrier-protein] synthase III C-terminal domain-containing protein [Pseudolabrys sp.]